VRVFLGGSRKSKIGKWGGEVEAIRKGEGLKEKRKGETRPLSQKKKLKLKEKKGHACQDRGRPPTFYRKKEESPNRQKGFPLAD